MNSTILIVAFVLATLLHYGVQKLFIHYKRFDDFNHRSSHKTLATRTGGIGIFLTVQIISLFYYFQGIELFDYSLFIPLGIMFLIGVYDDLYNSNFKLKFFIQIIVAKILIDQGYFINNFHGLFGLHEVSWLITQASTVFTFLVIVNAINFIDGIDGLAITEVIKTILLFELICSINTELFTLGLLIIISILPLYYFNFKKKLKVFLGDGGSLLLGTVLFVYTSFALNDGYNIVSGVKINKTLFVILILLFPLTDLLRVFIMRLINGKSPFEADQNHLHHFLSKKLKRQFIVPFICLFSLIIISAFLILSKK